MFFDTVLRPNNEPYDERTDDSTVGTNTCERRINIEFSFEAVSIYLGARHKKVLSVPLAINKSSPGSQKK